MKTDLEAINRLNLVKAVKSGSDSSLREKPYARLKESHSIESDQVSAEDYLIESCEERGIWPIEILLDQFSQGDLTEAINYITDCGDRARFDPPRTLSELRTEKCAYFAGVAAGDGGFNGPKTWSVVDGGKEHELNDSQEFIEKISRLIQDIFGLQEESIWINKKENRVELKLTNKWFARYIRYCFDLPKSYKKGKLSRPDIFKSEENIAAFWRGVFDTDGSVSSKGYRVSMGTATETFAHECSEDLERLDISANFRDSKNGYKVRVDRKDFEIFCNVVGFSHPRKRGSILSKLKKGARNYIYKGRVNENMCSQFYNLTLLEGLRVIGFGGRIKEFREDNDLYQKELASELDVSTDQIWSWENDNDAAPIDKIKVFIGSEEELLESFYNQDLRFKIGVRGNQNSAIKLPIKIDSEVDAIASKVVSTKNELRVKNMNNEIASQIEELFGVRARRDEHKISFSNWTLVRFFSKFYRYEPTFFSHGQKELKNIKEDLKIT